MAIATVTAEAATSPSDGGGSGTSANAVTMPSSSRLAHTGCCRDGAGCAHPVGADGLLDPHTCQLQDRCHRRRHARMSLDGAPFRPCHSPPTYTRLKPGRQTTESAPSIEAAPSTRLRRSEPSGSGSRARATGRLVDRRSSIFGRSPLGLRLHPLLQRHAKRDIALVSHDVTAARAPLTASWRPRRRASSSSSRAVNSPRPSPCRTPRFGAISPPCPPIELVGARHMATSRLDVEKP